MDSWKKECIMAPARIYAWGIAALAAAAVGYIALSNPVTVAGNPDRPKATHLVQSARPDCAENTNASRNGFGGCKPAKVVKGTPLTQEQPPVTQE